METHPAVATVSKKGRLAIIQAPTIPPTGNEVRIRVEWAASTPLDLHQNDGGILVTHPQILGDSAAGTVVEVGDQVQRLKVGDKIFGFVWSSDAERGQQVFVTAPEWKFGIVPEGFTLPEVVTVPNNLVTAWHTLTTDLGVPLPWPKPDTYVPENADEAILVWGGSSSVGQYAIQLLKYYGYTNVIAAASSKHHAHLRSLGATKLIDYKDRNAVEQIAEAAEKVGGAGIKRILDCIGSLEGSMRPIARIAKEGTKVAVMLPVIVRDSTDAVDPIYAMDMDVADWDAGVEVRGVRTHYYAENEFHRDHLMADIVPALLQRGIVKPNSRRIVEGNTLLERAQKGLDALRRKEVSGERLVWRVADA